jgi:S-adenosylmethionine-diacylgycerolhomoserine-N-methlytransferase
LNGDVPRDAGEDPGTHFALMDRIYRRQRHFYDFTRRYYLLGRDRLIREMDVRPGESVLEVGCGTARNLIRIGRTYPGAHLFGLDASSEMLRSASAAVARAGLESRVRLACGLAEELQPALFGRSQPFDHVLFSYSLSMIPDWRGALAAAHGSLVDGGRAHVVDFGDLRGLIPIFSMGLRGWLRLFHVTLRDDLLAQVESAQTAVGAATPTVLSGRYAFLWRGTREDLQRLARSPVASPPQVGRKS